MIFDYTEKDFNDGVKKMKLYNPLLKATLTKRGFALLPVYCLLDSGADDIIFPLELAMHYKIKYKDFYSKRSSTAGGEEIILYEIPYEGHKMDFYIEDLGVVREKICFTQGQQMPLLGQSFFQHFKVCFERKNKKFMLEKI